MSRINIYLDVNIQKTTHQKWKMDDTKNQLMPAAQDDHAHHDMHNVKHHYDALI